MNLVPKNVFEAGKAAGENDRAMGWTAEDRADCPKCWKNSPAELEWLRGYETGRWPHKAAA